MAVTERCTSLEAALVAAATRHDTLQTRHAALEDALETALLNRQVELETARMRTEAQEGRYAALHLSQAALEDALETALLNRQVELETARMSQAAVQAREAVLREAQEVLQASHETLQANLGQLQTSHGQLQVSHRSLMERLEASGARLEESERRCTAYEEQRGALRTRLDESQAAAQAAQAQVEETAMALEALDRERGLDARWQARLYSRAMRSAVRRWRAIAAMPEAAARALLARRERVEVDAALQRLQELSRHARCLRSALHATRECCHRRLRHALTQWRHCIRQ
jgi:chromosome segregation ATPase